MGCCRQRLENTTLSAVKFMKNWLKNPRKPSIGDSKGTRSYTGIAWAVVGISSLTIALCVAADATNPAKTVFRTPDSEAQLSKPISAPRRSTLSAADSVPMPPKAKQATTKEEAKNILAQGSGSNSAFTYDPFGRLVKIVEPDSSVRQFVYNGNTLCEERDGTGTVTKQFFDWGEVISGTKYVYTRDHLGSVREMSDSSGNIVAEYSYDAFGRVTKVKGSGPDSDFLYAGYFYHKPSGLYITAHRVYSPKLGRWLSRDPINEPGFAMTPQTPDVEGPSTMDLALEPPDPNMLALNSVSNNPIVRAQVAQSMQLPSSPMASGSPQSNPYAYVANDPINHRDASGLLMTPPRPKPAPNVCPVHQNNDLYNHCVEKCKRENAGDPQGIANCIWLTCKKFLGEGGG